ncbi:transposase [Nocardia rhamnosiphila]
MNHIRRYKTVDARLRTTAVQQARALMADGYSRTAAARAVAPAFGVHVNTVSNWVRDAIGAEPGDSVPELQEKVRKLSKELASTQSLVRDLLDGHTSDGPHR